MSVGLTVETALRLRDLLNSNAGQAGGGMPSLKHAKFITHVLVTGQPESDGYQPCLPVAYDFDEQEVIAYEPAKVKDVAYAKVLIEDNYYIAIRSGDDTDGTATFIVASEGLDLEPYDAVELGPFVTDIAHEIEGCTITVTTTAETIIVTKNRQGLVLDVEQGDEAQSTDEIVIPCGGGAKTVSCGWLRNVKETSCWSVFRRGGRGQCGNCFETEDISDIDDEDQNGAVAKYVSDLDGWLAVERKSGDWPMVNTCCGCGSLLFKIDDTTFKPSLVLGGIHVACDDEEVYTTTLDEDYVCGELEDGRRYVQFFGYDVENACDGTEEPCVNEYSIMLVCGAECPQAACECDGCGADTAPIAWYALGVSGFADAKWNGDWVLRNTGPCTWEADCDGTTSSLQWNDLEAGQERWRLTHGGVAYEGDPSSPCSGEGMTLDRVGFSGPMTFHLTPVQGEGDIPDCRCCVEQDLPDTLYMHLNQPFGGTLTPCVTGLTLELEWDGSAWSWSGAFCSGTGTFALRCREGIWEVKCLFEIPGFDCSANTSFFFATTQRCDPFEVTSLYANTCFFGRLDMIFNLIP